MRRRSSSPTPPTEKAHRSTWKSATARTPASRTASAAARPPGFGRFPSRHFHVNQVWLELSLTALDLLAWARIPRMPPPNGAATASHLNAATSLHTHDPRNLGEPDPRVGLDHAFRPPTTRSPYSRALTPAEPRESKWAS